MKLFDSTLNQLEHALDARLERQNLLSADLANADTPGFRAKDLDFNAAMSAAHQRDEIAVTEAPGDMPLTVASGSATDPSVVDAPGSSPGIDGNRVDADRTMVSLAENALEYGAAAKAAGKKLAILRYVASDGAA